MDLTAFKFNLELDMELIRQLIVFERFDAIWSNLEKRSMNQLSVLRSKATTLSLGAVLRLEGFDWSEARIESFLMNYNFRKEDSADVRIFGGYVHAESYFLENSLNFELNEPSLKDLQKNLLQFSPKDDWHCGDYKRINNNLEIVLPDGSKELVFRATEPGIHTIEAMKQLFDWYYADQNTIGILKIAIFIYEFLCIRPFQDGNGRLSYLMVKILMMQNNYSWFSYLSFEKEIEQNRQEYFTILKDTQKHRPAENIIGWLKFFMSCMINLQDNLKGNILTKTITTNLSVKEKKVCTIIKDNPGICSSEISKISGIPLPSIKKMLKKLVMQKFISKEGIGKATNYC